MAELRANLQVEFFQDLSILHQRQIHILITRPIDNIPSCISKSTASRKDKCCCVEPSLRGAIAEVGTRRNVRAVIRAEAQNRSSRATVVDIRKESDCKRSTRLQRDNAIRFPAGEERCHPA